MITTYGPYEPVRKAGNFYYTSGQVGVDTTSKTISTDVAEQTTQALRNVAAALRTVGISLQDVVKTTVFLTDMSNFTAMNDAYEEGFETPRPARSTIGVRELPNVKGLSATLVEIEAVAYVETP